jgi:hypothetical protein
MFLNKKKLPIIISDVLSNFSLIGETLKIIVGSAKWSKIRSYQRIKLLMFIKKEKQKIN